MNLTFLIILVVLILLGVWGWFYGFIKMVCVLCSSIIIFVLTLFLSPVTTKVLSNSESFYNLIYEKVAGNIDLPKVDAQTALDYFDTIDSIPSGIEGSLKEGLSDLAGNVNSASDDAGEYIRDRITLLIIKVIAFIVTYIIVSILIGIIFRIFNVISKLPVINIANRALGITAGVLMGIFLVFVFMAVVSFLSPGTIADGIASDINSSTVLSFLYEHNFISPFVDQYLR